MGKAKRMKKGKRCKERCMLLKPLGGAMTPLDDDLNIVIKEPHDAKIKRRG